MIGQYTRRARNPWHSPEFLDKPFDPAATPRPSAWQQRRQRAAARLFHRLAAMLPSVDTGKAVAP